MRQTWQSAWPRAEDAENENDAYLLGHAVALTAALKRQFCGRRSKENQVKISGTYEKPTAGIFQFIFPAYLNNDAAGSQPTNIHITYNI